MLLFFNSQAWAIDYMAGLSDPTRPYDAKQVTAKKAIKKRQLILQSTLVSPQRRSAVINGLEKNIGSNIYGAEVIDIKPYEVIVMRDGHRETLRMLAETLTRPVTISGVNHE